MVGAAQVFAFQSEIEFLFTVVFCLIEEACRLSLGKEN